MPVVRNENAPHGIVLFLRAEIHEKLQGGHFRGDPSHKEEKVFQIDCHDASHAQKRLADLIAELKQWCRST